MRHAQEQSWPSCFHLGVNEGSGERAGFRLAKLSVSVAHAVVRICRRYLFVRRVL